VIFPELSGRFWSFPEVGIIFLGRARNHILFYEKIHLVKMLRVWVFSMLKIKFSIVKKILLMSYYQPNLCSTFVNVPLCLCHQSRTKWIGRRSTLLVYLEKYWQASHHKIQWYVLYVSLTRKSSFFKHYKEYCFLPM
jgi:hypothetical protein